MMNSGGKKILVIGAEPGSGSTLGPIASRMKHHVRIHCSPRAVGVFREFGLRPEVVEDPKNRAEAFTIVRSLLNEFNPDVVLSTLLGPVDTSLDRAAARVCAKQGRNHVAVLDSWMNLDSRFDKKKNRFVNTPSIIAVPDAYTRKDLVAIGIPEKKVVITGHPFFDEIKRRADDKRKAVKNKRICFLLQPLTHLASEGVNTYGYTEHSVVEMFFEALNELPLPPESFEIVLREHPRKPSDYSIPRNLAHRTHISAEGSGWDLVNRCDVVVGMSSTLLIYTFLAAIPTIVAQPGLTPDCDPNMLTDNAILPNTDTPLKLKREMARALTDPIYQRDPGTEKKRAAFPLEGVNSEHIIQIIERICE